MKSEEFKINLKKIDRKIKERKNIPAGKFIDQMEDILKLRFANDVKRITL
jgi:hypothetical protein